MDCESLRKTVNDKDIITKGMNKEQLSVFTELLEHACEGHDNFCECGYLYCEDD